MSEEREMHVKRTLKLIRHKKKRRQFSIKVPTAKFNQHPFLHLDWMRQENLLGKTLSEQRIHRQF
jgi:hypothetical protein